MNKKKPMFPWAVILVVVIASVILINYAGGLSNVIYVFMSILGRTGGDNQTQPAITSLELSLGDSEADMRATIGIWVQASGAGPFEGAVVQIHGKYLGTDQEAVGASVLLDSNGFFLDSHRFEYPGYYKFWATYGTLKSEEVSLKISGVKIEVPEAFNRGSIFTIKVYSDKAGEFVVWYAFNGDWTNEFRFSNEVDVNEGGYGRNDFLWWPANVGNYWFDARQGTYTSLSFGDAVFSEVS